MGSVASTIIPIALQAVVGTQKEQKNNQQASIENDLIQQQAAADEERRQRAIKSAMATQRARYGATGVSAEDGSAEAVLLGLFEASEEDAAARLERDSLRMRANELGSVSSGRNLLTTTERLLGSSFSNIFFS